jgi:hypothetical protein
MKRALLTGLASLLLLALIAPAAQGATRIRQVQVEIPASGVTPSAPSGTLTLDFVFKNRRTTKHKFTPRRLIRIDFSHVPLTCMNDPSQYASQLLYTESFEVNVKLKKAPPPRKPKPGRYAFRFAYGFPSFTGTLTGTIDKPSTGPRPRLPRSQGTLIIDDLDANPGHMNCSTMGRKSWGGLPLTGA